ncbi:acyl-CoA thioesterase [Polynucleobacter rarus]|jgi:acyl-CoA thioester hydrolase|uniref:acyl-CoA thioesterase n=1 Tax=Polynucleobacter rarus TaxID=556055 RepID=UPI000D3E3F87|nr:thioesterase family protein [Polynucleobacter rarus]
MAKSDFSFIYPLRVRWSEIDQQAIVFNSHYLTYCDIGFTEYWRNSPLPNFLEMSGSGLEFFVKKAAIEYHQSAKFDDLLDVCVRCSRLGNSSMTITTEIYLKYELLINAELTYVYANTATKKSAPIPTEWRSFLLSEAVPKP